jgi:rod shape-determining protein MreB and related proteins
MAGKKVAIDLGTANSLVAIHGKGIVVREPTVVAISLDDKKIIAVGKDAKEMLGKVPGNIIARRPMRQGVIASYKLTEALIKNLLNKALGKNRFFKPEVMISVPAGITSVEERAVIEAAVQAGAGKVYLIPEPLAAAVGAKLPISSSSGNMIVNMGGGTSEIAVISMNGIVIYNSKRVAGDYINESIAAFIRKRYNLIIGEQMAENIKIEIGSAVIMKDPIEMNIRGRDAGSGLPISLTINSNDIIDPIKIVLIDIINSIKSVLEKTPPELLSDIIDRGMVLSGGTANLRHIDEFFTSASGVPAHVVENPMTTVIDGIMESLNHLSVIKRSIKGY